MKELILYGIFILIWLFLVAMCFIGDSILWILAMLIFGYIPLLLKLIANKMN